MSCLIGGARPVIHPLQGKGEVVITPLCGLAKAVSQPRVARASIVCSVSEDLYTISWGKDVVLFTSADNKVGTIKFNTLTAKGDWVLSEVTIEELL